MSDAETGVYITLIARMYEMAGAIENDTARLSRLCGCKSTTAFKRSLQFLIDDGKIQLIDNELSNEKVQNVVKNLTIISSKAKSAAEARWSKKRNKNNDGGNASASVGHMPQPCQPKPKKEKKLSNDSSKKRASRLTDDWCPTRDFTDWPIQNLHWTLNRAQGQLSQFKDYWVAKSGKDAAKLDWLATWRNWCRNDERRNPTRPQEKTLAEMAAERWSTPQTDERTQDENQGPIIDSALRLVSGSAK